MSDIQEQTKIAHKKAEENDRKDTISIQDLFDERNRNNQRISELVLKIEELQKQLDFMIDRNDEKQNRIDKATNYINVIKENTPSSPRKDYAKMILINYEDLLNKLQGDNK